MRFPHQATLKIVPVSPLSDVDNQSGSARRPFFDRLFRYPCQANATSGTFDPGIQFQGQDLDTGAFGSFVDVWVTNRIHRQFMQVIEDSGISFSAPLMLRLMGISKVLPNQRLKESTLFDSTMEPDCQQGFPLSSTRVYPVLTAFTFELKRVGL